MNTDLDEELHNIRSLSLEQARSRILDLPESHVSWTFIASLNQELELVAFKFCLLLWHVTRGSQIPRQIQLECALSVYQRKDTLFVAGTGSGKTLVVILLALLRKPGHIMIMVSPFKHLQESMATDMRERYHLNVIVINEETNQDVDWWKKKVFNTVTKTVGQVDIIITTLEQCFRSREGHLPRLGYILRYPAFQSKVEYEIIDEIHESDFSGHSHYGVGAFRPAWGFPKHILPSVNQAMGGNNYARIQTSLNRPTIVYASHCVPGTLENIDNYRCFVAQDFDPKTHKRILFFCDNRKQTWILRNALETFLPPEWQGKGIVQHYHSQMSKTFLEHVHVSFAEEGGSCRFLVATSAESTGVDFPDIDMVVNVGLPPSQKDANQRAGRVVRREGRQGLFLILYEAWVLEIDLSEYDNQWASDPDWPCKRLTDNSNRRERAPFSMVHMIQLKECQRHSYASYLGDQHELSFAGEYCCDSTSHEKEFSLQDYLPGKLTSEPCNAEMILVIALKHWHRAEHHKDSLRAAYREWFILDDKDLELIARLHPEEMSSIDDLYNSMHCTRLEEWKERWGIRLYDFLREFNELRCESKSVSGQKRKQASALSSTSSNKKQKIEAHSKPAPLQPSSTSAHCLVIRIPPRSQLPNFESSQKSMKENI
ncbi:P-loop containing nucleoside triphosphate hydrolase protein [Lentinula raphanica]|nr:P-loop containing nucleoside triphosphate hydrolase protein [Lentinula raphanica]